ncbi:MAG: ACT domain-containing protein [Bacteroidota bacterium]
MPDSAAMPEGVGTTDLAGLLGTMEPVMQDGAFVFVTVPTHTFALAVETDPVAAVMEAEGLTLVLPQAQADALRFGYGTVFRQLTLTVHSSLDAVGLTAAVATRLAAHGIPANVIAGYYHDHLFVPHDRAEEALAALRALSREQSGEPGSS